VSVTEIGRETGQDREKVNKHLAEDAACGALAAGTRPRIVPRPLRRSSRPAGPPRPAIQQPFPPCRSQPAEAARYVSPQGAPRSTISWPQQRRFSWVGALFSLIQPAVNVKAAG
jgi:hypothetical protein